MIVSCSSCEKSFDTEHVDELWALDDREIAAFVGQEFADMDPKEYAWCSRVCCLAWLANASYEWQADLTLLVIDAYCKRKVEAP